ncbi:NAD(P)/FAD-dependent oxidoreductase [Methylonatrum kenyense]|uniref:NAD(P)/FAD-dependent oxidoreductase n=1 Tax=Methylonatrum kenyense TaxID=455253 RepID=UPI0020C11C8D|nr:NAD(P)/FAD-dependent oxidoreductase [Methylonatrum kenyense]MCK8517157.1 NAD(P)/FAD-dependent oxidoreductase [Methylonatrum kenyense]
MGRVMGGGGRVREQFDLVIIGGGAAGLMCGLVAGQRGRRVLVADHANKVGKKILMSGGGRCNFTNMHCGPDNFLSANPHFMKSALSRYTPWDFIAMVERYGIPYHEKTLGQLFCDRSSKDILQMLVQECRQLGVTIRTRHPLSVEQLGPPHHLHGPGGAIACESLVVATGGLSIPRMGATGFGLELARALGLPVRATRAGLVPVTLPERERKPLATLSGVALRAAVCAGSQVFREALLFTHRGLSGPAVLQASSYWQPGEALAIDLYPGGDLADYLRQQRAARPKRTLRNTLAAFLTRRVAAEWIRAGLPDTSLESIGDRQLAAIAARCQQWQVWPDGTEGYATAEVTLGGVDTDALSSKTMECRRHPGLYFIGEVVDVTGHLGGHNFQWAWASGHAAGVAA